jgi:hypothetical protein
MCPVVGLQARKLPEDQHWQIDDDRQLVLTPDPYPVFSAASV